MHNVEIMIRTSSIYDQFISFDLQMWPWPSTYLNNCFKWHFLKENSCAKLFSNPCINVEVMAWTSSTDDHFILCPSSVILTFNLPEQMFQMTLLLLKEKNCAKSFWNPCTNVQVMAWTNPDGHMHAQCTHAHTPNRKRAGQKYVLLSNKEFAPLEEKCSF